MYPWPVFHYGSLFDGHYLYREGFRHIFYGSVLRDSVSEEVHQYIRSWVGARIEDEASVEFYVKNQTSMACDVVFRSKRDALKFALEWGE